jgi:hypothetical protein
MRFPLLMQPAHVQQFKLVEEHYLHYSSYGYVSGIAQQKISVV